MKKDNIFIYKIGDNLYINLTNRCCNACEFCVRTHGDGLDGSGPLWLLREPSADEIIKQIRDFKESYGEMVFCGYGESTYRVAEMVKIAEYAHFVGKKTRLNTNGLGNLINGRNIVSDLKGRIDIVSVSLNESSAEKYDKLCHPVYGLKAYPEILDFTEKCVKAGIETVMTVVDTGNIDIDECRKNVPQGAALRVRAYID